VVFTQMTVRENLEMGAYLERDRAKVQASMDFVYSLFPRLGERPRQQDESVEDHRGVNCFRS